MFSIVTVMWNATWIDNSHLVWNVVLISVTGMLHIVTVMWNATWIGGSHFGLLFGVDISMTNSHKFLFITCFLSFSLCYMNFC